MRYEITYQFVLDMRWKNDEKHLQSVVFSQRSSEGSCPLILTQVFQRSISRLDSVLWLRLVQACYYCLVLVRSISSVMAFSLTAMILFSITFLILIIKELVFLM